MSSENNNVIHKFIVPFKNSLVFMDNQSDFSVKVIIY